MRGNADVMAGVLGFATETREKLKWEYKIGLWPSGASGNLGHKMLIADARR
jgi:hypothetical protein